MLCRNDIHKFLEDIGISKTDTVLVHTSMRSLGEVEGGCDGLIDAFTSYLSEGLFIVPTHTWANVNENDPVYDVRSTKPCIGALPTVAAFRKDGIRSLHPTHSVAAFGKRAAEFVKGEENAHAPCPAGGAWARLYDEDARILLLGVGLNNNTYIHAIDEMLDLPNRLREHTSTLTVIDHDGNSHDTILRRHGSMHCSNYFENFRKPLEHFGALKNFELGNARIGLFYTKQATEIIKTIWSRADVELCDKVQDIPEEYYL